MTEHERAIVTAIEALPDVTTGRSRFGGMLAFRRGKREFGHFHHAAELDIRVPRNRQRELREDGRVTFRARGSDWMEFRVKSAADARDAIELLREAHAAAE